MRVLFVARPTCSISTGGRPVIPFSFLETMARGVRRIAGIGDLVLERGEGLGESEDQGCAIESG